jgi:hypothetical protein
MNLTKVRAKDMQELGGADSLIHKVVWAPDIWRLIRALDIWFGHPWWSSAYTSL